MEIRTGTSDSGKSWPVRAFIRLGFLALCSLASGCANSKTALAFGTEGPEPPVPIILRVEVLDVQYANHSVGRSGWYVYRAQVKTVISGTWTAPEVSFVHLQHGKFVGPVTRDCYVTLRPAGRKLRAQIGPILVADPLLSRFWMEDRVKIENLKQRRAMADPRNKSQRPMSFPTMTSPYALLFDDEIELRLVRETPADLSRDWLPGLFYDIHLKHSGEKIGNIDLRVGYTLSVARYGGNIAYGVDERHRGHHYAGKACRLLKDVAIAKGMDVIWITCNPDNWPSRKTCEWAGATLVETVDLPEDNDQYQEGQRRKCRYRWILQLRAPVRMRKSRVFYVDTSIGLFNWDKFV